jgi:hypothetical protein
MGPDNEQKKIIAKLKQSNNKINKAKNSQEFCEAFKERCKMGYGFGDIPGSKEILKKIKNTKDKNIQMCIALYYKDADVTENLYFKTKDEKIRIACLEKKSSFPLWQDFLDIKKDFFKFLKTSTDKEFYSYFINKNFKLTYIERILNKDWPYNKISEKLYRNIILILEDNPNTQVDPDNLTEKYKIEVPDIKDDYDGWGQYTDQKIFKAYKKELNLIKKLRNLE